jgi:DNA-binding PadR family transcriptional regulator
MVYGSVLHWLVLVLVLVIERPSYGYEIEKSYGLRFGSLLPAGQGSVYHSLRWLAQRNLIKKTSPKPQSGVHRSRGRRVNYKATTRGRRALRRWLSSPVRQEQWRMELLAQIIIAGMLDAELLPLIDRYDQEVVAHIERLEHLSIDEASVQHNVATLTTWLASQEQLMTLAAQRRWANLARHRIHQFSQPRHA